MHLTARHLTAQAGPPLTHEVAVQVDLPTASAHGDEKRATVRTTLARPAPPCRLPSQSRAVVEPS
eukprot:scaffold88443_cov46-Phaeocystis_antarctica.AAC.3